MGMTEGTVEKIREGIKIGKPLRWEVTRVTAEGVSNWERREWDMAWGKMEKEDAGKDQDRCVGTVIWQAADLEVLKKPVQIPRKTDGSKVSTKLGSQGKASAPRVPLAYLQTLGGERLEV